MIATPDEIDLVFDSLDNDKSGSLEYKELNKQLRVGAGSANDEVMKGKPKRCEPTSVSYIP